MSGRHRVSSDSSSKSLREIWSHRILELDEAGLNALRRLVTDPESIQTPEDFTAAMIALAAGSGLTREKLGKRANLSDVGLHRILTWHGAVRLSDLEKFLHAVGVPEEQRDGWFAARRRARKIDYHRRLWASGTSTAEQEARRALSEAEGDVAAADELTLPALWGVTHKRLDYYHEIATGQARQSFRNAQIAMAAGFVLLVSFALLAFFAESTAAAAVTGVLGATSAAFAAYISRTFVRSQETAAAHLRSYFDQPLEFSRFLAAERLLNGVERLDGERRAAITADLLKGILPTQDVNGTNKPTTGESA